MKTLSMALALATAAVALPAAAQTLPPAVIGIVNMDTVFNNSAAGKTAIAELKPRIDGLQQRFAQLRTQFGTEQKNLQATQPAPTAPPATKTAWEAKVRDLETRQAQAQQELANRDRDIQASRQYVQKQLDDATQPIISTVMRERGITVVLHEASTIQHAASVDITNDVIARLDKATPRVSTTAPAAPAPAAAAPK
jgi:Skp family chaperone for outer membrane proteins